MNAAKVSMSENLVCNLCDKPGTYDEATEIGKVPCHVRCFQNDMFTVWRCNSCGSIHSKEDPDLNTYYADYPFKNHTLDYHTRIGYRNRLRMLKKQGFRPEHRLLDFGCGKGLFLSFLCAHGYPNVFGFDSFVDQYADPSILQEHFDVIVSYDVIEHVDDPREFLEALVTALRKGGLLVLGTPNADHLKLSNKKHQPVELSQPYHRHIFSEQMLLQLGAEFGLEVVHTYRRFYFDSLYPSVNTRFMWAYVQRTGGMIDVCVESPRLKVIFRSPKLIFYALFGYFFPPRSNILFTFTKVRESLRAKQRKDYAHAG